MEILDGNNICTSVFLLLCAAVLTGLAAVLSLVAQGRNSAPALRSEQNCSEEAETLRRATENGADSTGSSLAQAAKFG